MTVAVAELAMERVAQRIEAWSRAERKLRGALAELRPSRVPTDGIGGHPGRLVGAPSLDGANGLTAQCAAGIVRTNDPPMATQWVPVARPPLPTFQEPNRHDKPVPEAAVTVRQSTPEIAGTPPSVAGGPFDGLLDSVTSVTEMPNRPLPPRSRFMVRVAQVPKPHRVTKRDYNYFEELNAALAVRSAGPRCGSGG